MAIDKPLIRWVLTGIVVLLLIPVVVMLGMMLVGTAAGTGMMAQMGGMMGVGTSGAWMGLCILWTALLAAALVFLIVLLNRGNKPPRQRQEKAA
jgi:uncharacterized membrane protein